MFAGYCSNLHLPVCSALKQARSVICSMSRVSAAAMSIALVTSSISSSALAQSRAPADGIDPLIVDSFAIGSNEGALCQVQSELTGSAFTTIFDRSWAVICRDAAQPVGQIWALRGTDALQRIAARTGGINCPSTNLVSDGVIECTDASLRLPARRHIIRRGDTIYVGEGLAAYDDAIRIALTSIVERRVVPGTIAVATTSVGDPEAMTRVQVGYLSADRALAEGYRRNNSGDFAGAAVYFEALERRPVEDNSGIDASEFRLNRSLQLSNLGDFGAAEQMLASVEAIPTSDIVQVRLRRNFRAMHMLNRRDYDGALAVLDRRLAPLPTLEQRSDGSLAILPAIAAGLNSDSARRVREQVYGEDRLTPEERALGIDSQASQLRGTLLRLSGNLPEARGALAQAMAQSMQVRDGRVTSIIRLQSQILGELAAVEEAADNAAAAEARHQDAIALLQREYPETLALSASRARLAAFLSRQGRTDDSLTQYRLVVSALIEARRQLTGVYNQMAPYYQMLIDRQDSDPGAISEFFNAIQLLVRPGVADTQSQLARELSSGGGESATLFRQANNLARDIERTRIELSRLVMSGDTSPASRQMQAQLQSQIANLAADQTVTLTQLSQYPQYRAVAQEVIALPDLQAALTNDELYLKLAVIGENVFALSVSRDGARAWRTELTNVQLDAAVDTVRNSISVQEGGQYTTYPFDAEAAYALYTALFAPAAADLARHRHVIFEPDGAMLRLPINLLITDEQSVRSYRARADAPGGDPFDMRGVVWLGQRNRVTTAVSPLAFSNTRSAPPSRAGRAYLGLGNNLPVSDVTSVAAVRGSTGTSGDGCDWALSEWNQPISPTELYSARDLIGAASSEIITGASFTDASVRRRDDLSNYRIVHFATHGLVTPPRPECPTRPALLTSFDEQDSDGLLSFDEIFGLRLDADLVILSACDTAGEASIAATREAGVTTGGGSALDGLVRAFIGAGSRTVLASHWPAPDDFDATQRLIGGIFRAGGSSSIAEALGQAQDILMAESDTSHPYYWAGFAIIGDGATIVARSAVANSEAADVLPQVGG